MSAQASQTSVPTAQAGSGVSANYNMFVVGSRYEAAPTVVIDGEIRGFQITSDGKMVTSAVQSGAWTVAATQSGAWTTGRTWTLSSGTDSIAALQSGAWTVTQSGAWNITNITGTVSLPTNAAQETGGNLASLNTKLPSQGPAAKAASVPVTMATDQPDIGTKGTIDVSATGNITIQNSNPNSGVATAGSTIALTSLRGQITWGIQVTGVYTGALTPQVTVDGTNWIALSATSVTNVNTNAQTATVASAAVGIFEVSAPPCAQLRLTALGAMTGTAVVTILATTATGRVGLDSPIPAGTAIIGALSANQSSNVAQVNGVAPLMGNGVTGTGSMRVTIASDTSSNTNPLLIGQKGLASANAPVQTTYTVGSPVTTAAYTQLIASTTSATTFVDIFDSSGQTMILATGAGGSEVIQAYIPPGGDSFFLAIPAGTRVAIKALTANATSGYNLINLRG